MSELPISHLSPLDEPAQTISEDDRQILEPVASQAPPPHLRVVPAHDHLWALRETVYEDGMGPLRRFECHCGAVTFD